MAKAFTCDICGGFFEHRGADINHIDFATVFMDDRYCKSIGYDCCEHCLKAIKDAVNKRKNLKEVKDESAGN